MDDITKPILAIVALAMICIVLMVVIFALVGIKEGDTLTISKDTPVYDSYLPGKYGNLVCILKKDQKNVVIEDIFTANDVPGAEKTAVTEIKAFYITSPVCNGWVLR